MEIKIAKVKQYNATYKHVLMIDRTPIAIFTSQRRVAEAIQYVEGYDADVNDGAIKKKLDAFRKVPNRLQTKGKLKEKKKAIHGFQVPTGVPEEGNA